MMNYCRNIFTVVILTNSLYLICSEEETRKVYAQSIEAKKAYLNSVDNWEPIFNYLKEDAKSIIILFNQIMQNLDIDLFELDMQFRPNFYVMLEQHTILLNEYFALHPQKDVQYILECRDKMRVAFNNFLVYLHKNRTQIPLAVELFRDFNTSYFDIKRDQELYTKQVIVRYMNAMQAYCESVDNWQPIVRYLYDDAKSDIALFAKLATMQNIDFFALDMQFRPYFYSILEQHQLLVEEYESLYPEKNITEIKKRRDQMRFTYNNLLLYLHKNKDQISVVAKLLPELYQEYFNIVI